MRDMIKNFVYVAMGIMVIGCSSKEPPGPNQSGSTVQICGAMKNVMWKGELFGTIELDTISRKLHLYGVGPVEYLTGELLFFDGTLYESKVVNDTVMKVTEIERSKAPFFVYANVKEWREKPLPDSIRTIPQLDVYLNQITKNEQRPFAFKLSGVVEMATIHVVNLPHGAKVSSPRDAHQGQTDYYLRNAPSDIIGFFSTEHQAVFTHHDTYVHMHLITADRAQMGHLDNVKFKNGAMRLYLQVQ